MKKKTTEYIRYEIKANGGKRNQNWHVDVAKAKDIGMALNRNEE